jgi:phospholipid transport system transporter-binding protein
MLALPERLTHREAAAVLSRLESDLSAQPVGAAVVFDATPMQQYDTSALVVLLGLQRQARAQGRHCVLHAVPARLQQLAKVYGVLELLEVEAAEVA